MNYKKRDIVEVTGVPSEIKEMPQETIDIFTRCVGKRFPIAEVDDQQGYILYQIDVCDELTGSMKDLSNSIWIEPQYLKKDSQPSVFTANADDPE